MNNENNIGTGDGGLPPTKPLRRFRNYLSNIVLTFWRKRLYRHVMRFAHRFNWHYAPVIHGLDGKPGEEHRWCKWCGLRGTTYSSEVKNSIARIPTPEVVALKPNELSEQQKVELSKGGCPDCGSDLYEGPCGGMMMNVRCEKGHRFNITNPELRGVAPFFAERIL